MIGFDGVVRILLHNVTRRRRQLIEYPRIGRRPISAHLGWAWAVLESTGEEPASGRQIPLLGHQDINDLAILIDGPVQIDPTPSDLDICLIDEPPITRRVPAGPGRLNQQRGEPVHPPVHGHMVNLDASLGQ